MGNPGNVGEQMPPSEDVTIRRIAELERQLRELGPSVAKSFSGTVDALESAIATITAQQDYLNHLQVVSVASGTGGSSIGNSAWATAGGLRPSLSINSWTGRVKITISGLVSSACATFAIPGYINRDDQVSGTLIFNQLYAGSTGVGASRTFIVSGLPTDGTAITVQAECYGAASGSPLVGYIGIVAEVIPA